MNTACQNQYYDDPIDSSSTNSCDSLSELKKCKKSKKQKKQTTNGKVSFKVKVKTEICKYWSIEGYCPYGKDKCAFAHGKDEVRDKVHVPNNYKTKTCKNFTEEGFCTYGERCQFKHPAKKGSKLPQLPYNKLMDNLCLLFQSKCKLEKRSRGLPTLVEEL